MQIACKRILLIAAADIQFPLNRLAGIQGRTSSNIVALAEQNASDKVSNARLAGSFFSVDQIHRRADLHQSNVAQLAIAINGDSRQLHCLTPRLEHGYVLGETEHPVGRIYCVIQGLFSQPHFDVW